MTSFLHTAIARSPREEVKYRPIKWNTLIQVLSKPEAGVKDGRGWLPVEIADGPRRGERVESISLLVYDIDNKHAVINLDELADTITKSNYRAIVHSTYTHKPGSPRFRLILDVSRPIEPADFRELALRIAGELCIIDYIDRSCLDVSRFFYRPRCAEDRLENFVFRSYEGEPVDIQSCLPTDRSNVVSLTTSSSKDHSTVGAWLETESNIKSVLELLHYCPPDSSYETWRNIVWSVCSLEWDIGRKLVTDWSQQSEAHWDSNESAEPKEALSKVITSYDAERGITIGTLFKHAEDNGWISSPFENVYEPNQGMYTCQPEPDLDETASLIDDLLPVDGPFRSLLAFSVTGLSHKLKKKMLADVFVMRDVAILGQWTVLYAAPNTGKTLLTLWLLREQILTGAIDASRVFYVNADDTYKGMVTKLEIAEELGMAMLVPGHNGFSAGEMQGLMLKLVAANEARGVVIILDTLKKFTDLMDKRTATGFGVVARGFVSAGGTLITLAHTNKHRDPEGRSVYSGTSDIVDDSDCAYVMDQISFSESPFASTYTVEFTNKKCRGDVSTSLGLSFEKKTGAQYEQLLDSVKRIDTGEIDEAKRTAELYRALEGDAEIIDAICTVINSGTKTKAKIVAEAKKNTSQSLSRVRSVLENHVGNNYAQGDRWHCKPGDHNAQLYSVLPVPLDSV
jgi:hypothetical protein